ncbi:MAG: RES family NAD+ phosphorylase [Deltaproteobacteria bacterium]|nr:RES family NAD+ phosphorylase [Deltaproteobacteria bacterium]
MVVYRIAKEKYIRDLAGTGARLSGGRWNNKGVGILYASESRALAIVETLVHVGLGILPKNMSIVSIQVRKGITPKEISTSDLPDNWRAYPYLPEVADIGSKWALSNETLLLRVPSAVTPHEFNILINPSHPDFKHVKIIDIEDFTYDERIMRLLRKRSTP